MPAFLPLLGGIAKALGAKTLLSSALGGIGAAAKATKPVDVLSLGRSLGTPVPSAAQIKSAELAQLGNAAKGATSALIGLPGAVFATISAFEGFGAAVLSNREKFVQFNSGIAESFAKIARQDVMLGIRGGAAVSGSTTALADSFMALREDTQPMKEAMMNLWNVAGLTLVGLARIGTKALELLGFLALLEGLNALLNTIFGGSEGGSGIQAVQKEQLKELMNIGRKMKKKNEPLTPDPSKVPSTEITFF